MGDIGSHWFDMAEHLTGLRVRVLLCADLQIFHSTRKRPKQRVETFAGKLLRPPKMSKMLQVHTEDFGAVIAFGWEDGHAVRDDCESGLRLGGRTISSIEIYGTKSSVRWDQERPDELWIGQRNSPNEIYCQRPV